MSRIAFALPVILAATLSTSLRAQSPQAQSRVLTGGFWRTDSGFDSVLRLKNSLVVAPLTANPVIYMADGTEYDLPAVQLDTSAVATVDLNAALANAPASITPHISSFGSVAVRYSYTNPFALEASVGVISTLRSLSFTFPFHEQQNGPSQPQRIESLWWRHDSGVRGALILANTTSTQLQVTLSPFGALGTATPVSSLSLSPNATEVVSLESLISSLPPAESTQGGLRIEYSAPAGSLAFAGELVNPATGYSASMPFDYRPHKAPAATAQTYAAPGIMIGQQDASMGFTSDQRFAPYAFLRNTTSQPLAVGLTVATLGTNSPIQLPPVTLAPNQTVGINFPAEFAAVSGSANLGGIINLLVSYDGGPSDLLMSIGSVNQNGNFVSAILPESVGPNGARQAAYWKNADGSDTMITVWNPSAAAEDLLATFYFAGGSGQYQMPLHLNAGASQMLDMKELIAAQQPDAQGRTIPLGTRDGSLVLAGSKSIEDPVNISASAVIYNPDAATCSMSCTTCTPGVTSVSIETLPFATYISGQVQLQAWANYNTGSRVNKTSSSTWSSSNTSIATVSAGLVRGVSPGGDDISDFLNATGYGQNCPGMYDANGNPIRCPTAFQTVGGGSVGPVVSSIAPPRGAVGTTVNVTLTGMGFSSACGVNPGAGITTNSVSSSDSQHLTANFVISSSASVGNRSPNVTCNGQPSTGSVTFTVVPSVSVACDTLHLTLGTTNFPSTENGTCSTSNVNPTGGSFTWSANASTIVVSSAGSSASYSSQNPSSTQGDTAVTVTYTVNGVAGTATSSPITVHKPTALLTISTTPNDHTEPCSLPCLANPGTNSCVVASGTSCSYSMPVTERVYSVLDQFSPPNQFEGVQLSAVTVTESVSASQGTCGGNGVVTGVGGNSPFPDGFGKCDSCCEPGGPGCQSTATQTISVNGFQVRTENISETCTSVSLNP